MINLLHLIPRVSKGGRFWADCRAGAAAELALVLPGIIFIALNLTDLSVYIYSKMQVDLAAQEAVGAARVLCDTAAELPAATNCGSTLPSKMSDAAQTTSLGTAVTLLPTSTQNYTEKYYCADASATLKEVGLVTDPRAADCSGTIPGSTAKPGDYISVTASYNFASVFPGASVAALMPATITRTAWMRLQ